MTLALIYGTQIIRGATTEDAGFTVTQTAREHVITEAAQGQETVEDVVQDTYTSATVDTEADIFVTDGFSQTKFTSADTAIATVSTTGVVTRVSDGTAGIIVAQPKLSKRVDVAVSRAGGQTTSEFVSFKVGSLAEVLTAAVDAMLPGSTDGYTSRNHSTAVYVRNPDCWAPALTGVATWHTSRTQIGLTAITRDAVVGPNHSDGSSWDVTIGDTIRFVTADNVTVSRTVTGEARAGTSDLRVYALSSDLPETIDVYSVPPSDFQDYIPGVTNGIPCACPDQDGSVSVADLYGFAGTSAYYRESRVAARATNYIEKILGDSGYPAITLGTTKMLLSTWTSSSSGPATWDYLTELNAALVTAGSAYEVTVADLTAYEDWG